jgi:hypothetical protein
MRCANSHYNPLELAQNWRRMCALRQFMALKGHLKWRTAFGAPPELARLIGAI